nr:MAG TPA: hypothetical protein [Caudoviricetes sp.]
MCSDPVGKDTPGRWPVRQSTARTGSRIYVGASGGENGERWVQLPRPTTKRT